MNAQRALPILFASLLAVTACTSAKGAGTAAPTSTAAGPSAGETGSDGVDPAGGTACSSVQPYTWKVAPATTDQVAMIRDEQYPPPPIEGAGRPVGGEVREYATAEDFLAQSNVDDKQARLDVMAKTGFHGGIESEWVGEPEEAGHTVQALAFRDTPAAAAYLTERLRSLCGYAASSPVPLSNDGGVAYIDPVGAAHGWFIVGDSMIDLTLCSCGDVDADTKLAQVLNWYAAWVQQVASGPAVPVS